MASLLFKYLKDKATDDKTKDNFIYLDSKYRQYSYKDLYNLACQKIEVFKTYQVLGDKRYLLSLNDIQSISTLIALLELGYIPIILDGNKCKVDNEKTFLEFPELKMVGDALVVSDHLNTHFDVKSLESYIQSLYFYRNINPNTGYIGIQTSGSGYEPKTVFVNEKTLINRVFESKYVNEERILYNVAPLSSISGLFTNVFVPIISDNSKALLGDEFDVIDAIHSTDVYLPRNYSDIFKNTNQINNLNIKRIFTFGGQSSLAMYDFIRSKLSLPKNVFVNVYGTTECGGLVSEIEEKDMKELHVYLCRLSEDTLLYSYDDINMYLKTGKAVRKLTKKEFEEDYHIKLHTNYLPCGFTSPKISIKNGNCVGDCIVNGYETGDIVANVDDKYYIIGRKQLLEENGYLANFDNEISALINKTCATVSDRKNDLHLIIRCSIDDNENPFIDNTRYFRNLVKESKTMIEKIEERYPMIRHIEFLTSDYFVLSSGIKKPNRLNLLFFLNESAELRAKIDNFDEFIREYARKAFIDNLGYVPDHYFDDEYNIRINKNDISLEKMVDILNVFNVIFFYEENGFYKLINDDRAYLADFYRRRYNEIDLNYYKTYAQYGLLQEKLAADNKLYKLNLETEYPKIYEDFVETYVYSKVGIDNKGDTIILPYYAIEPDKNFSHLNDTEEKRNAEKRILDIIDKNYAYTTFEDHAMFVPYKRLINNPRYNFLGDYINLNEHELNYAHDIIKKAYAFTKNNNGHLNKILTL